MTDRQKKTRRAAADLTPLSPEEQSALKEVVAGLAAALEAGHDQETLLTRVRLRPEDPAWDFHFLREIEKVPHPGLPPLLAALFGASPDRERRKALKRALHVLKSKGVPVAGNLLPRDKPEEGTPPPSLALKAHVSPLYGNGECYLVVEGPREILGGNTLVARISDEHGFRECEVLTLSRRLRQEFWEQFASEGLGALAPAPSAYVLRLLEEALALTPDGEPSRDVYLPPREALWRYLGRPEEAPTPADLLPPLDQRERRRDLEAARDLIQQQFFAGWLPPLERVLPWLDKLREIQSSPLVLTEQQQRLRGVSLLEEAAAALFPLDTRPLWGRRLLKMAVFLQLRGLTEAARAAQAAAEDLLRGERSPLTGENPFLLGVVHLALRFTQAYSQQPPSPGEADPPAAAPSPLIRI